MFLYCSRPYRDDYLKWYANLEIPTLIICSRKYLRLQLFKCGKNINEFVYCILYGSVIKYVSIIWMHDAVPFVVCRASESQLVNYN